jgi:hypothetical protein
MNDTIYEILARLRACPDQIERVIDSLECLEKLLRVLDQIPNANARKIARGVTRFWQAVLDYDGMLDNDADGPLTRQQAALIKIQHSARDTLHSTVPATLAAAAVLAAHMCADRAYLNPFAEGETVMFEALARAVMLGAEA